MNILKNLTGFLCLALALVMTLPVFAQSRHYGVEMADSEWSSKKAKKSCLLSHAIPLYGEAVFVHRHTGELAFTMRVHQRAIKSGTAKLRRVIPIWHKNGKPGDEGKNIGKFEYQTGNIPFSLKETDAWQLLNELERGSMPTLTYKDWSGGRDEVAVQLSPVNFLPALEAFHQCAQNLAGK